MSFTRFGDDKTTFAPFLPNHMKVLSQFLKKSLKLTQLYLLSRLTYYNNTPI